MMQPEGGVKDLLKQLQQAAPSKLLVDDMVLNERIDNEMGVGGGGGLSPSPHSYPLQGGERGGC